MRDEDGGNLRSVRRAVTALESRANEEAAVSMPEFPHIRVGRMTVEQRVEGSLADMAAIKRLYNDAVSVASSVWDSASTEGKPDATMARTSGTLFWKVLSFSPL